MRKLDAVVFGKGHGCSKCTVLKSRLSRILEAEKYGDVTMKFEDVLTEPGMVEFLKAEVLNPNRIPALLMRDAETGEWLDAQGCGNVHDPKSTGHILGIQTDYNTGGGLISPQMIEEVLDRALEQ
jgi:hypothetical protein